MLQEAGLRLTQEMFFGVPEVKVLGCIVSVNGRRPNPEKLEAILKMADCRNVKDVKSFLGVCFYFSPDIKGYADIAAPRYLLLKDQVAF